MLLHKTAFTSFGTIRAETGKMSQAAWLDITNPAHTKNEDPVTIFFPLEFSDKLERIAAAINEIMGEAP